MKKILFVCAMLLATAAFSQTEKGGFLVGGGISLLTGEGSSQFAIDPNFGFLVANNFMLGGRVSYDRQNLGNIKTTQFGVGPFARYFVGQTTTKPFAVAEFDFISSTTKNGNSPDIKSNGTRFLFGLGFAAFVNNTVAVEGITGYTYSKFRDVDGSGGFTLRLGFGIYFNNNHMKDLKKNVVGE
jgi:hypothetical protein